jgi:hypothetical protein
MNTKIKRIMSAALVAVMVLSVAALASCDQSEAEKDIKVHMKITGSEGEICDMDLMVTGTASELTVLRATKKMCDEVYEIEFDYDLQLNTVKRIGSDIVKFFINDYPTEEQPAEEGEPPAEENAEEEKETEPEDVIGDYYYDWVCTVNGEEKEISDNVKEGDSIVWEWKQVQSELDK